MLNNFQSEILFLLSSSVQILAASSHVLDLVNTHGYHLGQSLVIQHFKDHDENFSGQIDVTR